MEEAEYCNRLALIFRGKIVALGTPSELKSSIGGDSIIFNFESVETAQSAVTLLTENIQAEKIKTMDSSVYLTIKDGERMMPDLLRSLDAKNLKVQSVTLSKPSLDDVFLKYTGRSLREDVIK